MCSEIAIREYDRFRQGHDSATMGGQKLGPSTINLNHRSHQLDGFFFYSMFIVATQGSFHRKRQRLIQSQVRRCCTSQFTNPGTGLCT